MPKAATAVLVGAEFGSVNGRGGSEAGDPLRKTPRGEIVRQLDSAKTFALVAQHEKTRTASSGELTITNPVRTGVVHRPGAFHLHQWGRPITSADTKPSRHERWTGVSLRRKATPMKTLGEFIREKREATGLSLRELARRLEITAPFLSDIELGRRAPAEKNLALIAKELGIPLAEIQQYDHRETVSDFKAVIESNPDLALAFRTQLKQVRTGIMTPQELEKRLKAK
ncbi:MAG: helix-turn-helix transcriptional regulator [Verrucomicrobiales bacterium]|nr:helix-turn-helix transcriptional regulator [Verrucomicrobiales bacterium]